MARVPESTCSLKHKSISTYMGVNLPGRDALVEVTPPAGLGRMDLILFEIDFGNVSFGLLDLEVLSGLEPKPVGYDA